MSILPSDLTSVLWGIAIGAFGALAAGFLKKAGEDGYLWIKGKINPESMKQSPPQLIVQIADNQINQSKNSDLAPILSPATIERISHLTFDEIAKSIDSAPPLQREQIAKNYGGLRVEWDAYFKNGYPKNNDEIILSLTTDPAHPYKVVSCTVRLSEYRELGVLPENAKIRVSGEISEVGRYEVTLSDVRLHFYES